MNGPANNDASLAFHDHFSRKAGDYARCRPTYPSSLFDFLASVAPGRRLAWDCGTGNGQAARELAARFDHVVATDASAEQLAHAVAHERIDYRVERAEDVSLRSGTVDLLTVATAVHWFDLEEFYSAVRRIVVPGGIIAVWTYHQSLIEPAIDTIMAGYHRHVLGGYWSERIRHQDARYRTLPFPFEEIRAPSFEAVAEWNLPRIVGFLESWSAAQRYEQEHDVSPVTAILPDLARAWGDPAATRTVRWPLYLRVGRVNMGVG